MKTYVVKDGYRHGFAGWMVAGDETDLADREVFGLLDKLALVVEEDGEEEEVTPDDLTTLDGLTSTMSAALNTIGIATFAQLAAAPDATLLAIPSINIILIVQWRIAIEAM